ncbi:hypothetical protein [Dermatophilus congolensis]|uniref:hypothetical protein n=1 Tax=Dermatophilus congolensis TaxID=1863 RepID=UPI0015F0A8FC|nr:hypothetical protein [Dermatophilus congolensis]MBO3143038.1 hypothetical protein [Dermatophilus congolensis]MBO3152026.1 hypothetical protein [Dermatophilus congolensis]MBO3160964.1 hypothetical protein [Dermatophilus congolensis]MBO3163311.1 hypothetical protein [Dermatophilus congolensis]MBO3176868.1 hypothetical protein [Dermatophilus congolensis]
MTFFALSFTEDSTLAAGADVVVSDPPLHELNPATPAKSTAAAHVSVRARAENTGIVILSLAPISVR